MAPALLFAQEGEERDVTGPPRGIIGKPLTSPSTGATPGSSPSSPNGASMRKGSIQIDRLSTITDANVGLLTEGSGGFARDMWSGSERAVLEALLPKLPIATPSHAVNDLSRRLILTTAVIPSGTTSGASLLEMRLQRLLDGGRYDDVIGLAGQIPAVNDSPRIAAIKAQAHLLIGQVTEACSLAQSVKDATENTIWLKIRTFCFAAAGENAAADLTAGLLRDQGLQDDAFNALVARITTGAEIDLLTDYQVQPIHVVMHGHLGLSPGDKALETMPPGLFAAIAADERFDGTLRLNSALKAERIGVLSVETLATLFDAVAFSEDVLAKPLSNADNQDDARAQALLYRALKVSTVPSASAELMRKAFTLAQAQGTYESIARLYWPVVRGLAASSAYASVSLDMARVAVINGDQTSAFSWFDLARQSGQVLTSELTDMRVLLAAAASSEQLAWRAAEPYEWLGMGMSAEALNRRIHEILVLEGLGYPIARNTSVRMLKGDSHSMSQSVSPVLLARLKSALVGRREGEAILLSLVALGEGGPASLSSGTLVEVFGALAQLGLHAEGRRILFDALAAGQLDAAHTAHILRDMALSGE